MSRTLGGLVRRIVKPRRAFSTALEGGVKNVVAHNDNEEAAGPADDENAVSSPLHRRLHPVHAPVDVAAIVTNLDRPDNAPTVHQRPKPVVHRLPTGGVVTQHHEIATSVIDEQLARAFSRSNVLRFHANAGFALRHNLEDRIRMAMFDGDYQPLDGMEPEEWLRSFAKAVDQYGNAFLNWGLVPDNGALQGWKRTTVKMHTEWDRYGETTGGYVAPAGTEFTRRAIAPINLTKRYTRYRVVREIPESMAMFSVVLPWFNARGLGDQVWFTEDGKTSISMDRLVELGYVIEVDHSDGPHASAVLAAADAADPQPGSGKD